MRFDEDTIVSLLVCAIIIIPGLIIFVVATKQFIDRQKEKRRKREEEKRQELERQRIYQEQERQRRHELVRKGIEEREKRALQRQQERNQKKFWLGLSGIEFEKELGGIFKRQGYEVAFTPTSGDQGIDLILKKDGKTIVVQCKAHKHPATPAIVRELYGSLISYKADEAILASLGGFTEGVRTFIVGKPIRLLDLDEIIRISLFMAPPPNSTISPTP